MLNEMSKLKAGILGRQEAGKRAMGSAVMRSMARHLSPVLLSALVAGNVTTGSVVNAAPPASPSGPVRSAASVSQTPIPGAPATAKPEAATRTSWKVHYIGHSLLSRIPDAVSALVASSPDGLRISWKEQNIPGAPLHFQWTEPERGKFQFEPQYQQRYDLALAAGDVDTLVLTDGVPRGGPWQENETYEQLVKFAELARAKNPKTRVLYYETWPCLDTGTPKGCEWDTHSPTRNLRWTERVAADRAMWRRIVARANATLAEKKVPGASSESPVIVVIPAGPALAKAVEEARAGKLPGFSSEDDFFSDRIHINALGAYAVGCVHYAAITGRSPVGLAADIKERWGRGWWTKDSGWERATAPSAEVIRRVQEIAWETVRAEPGLLEPAAAK
jgi:hypothetical protein